MRKFERDTVGVDVWDPCGVSLGEPSVARAEEVALCHLCVHLISTWHRVCVLGSTRDRLG